MILKINDGISKKKNWITLRLILFMIMKKSQAYLKILILYLF